MFEEILKIEEEISKKTDQLLSLRALQTSVTSAMQEDKVQSSPSQDKLCELAARVVDLEKEINALRVTLGEKRLEVERLISTISNPDEYDLMFRRYILGHSVARIAKEKFRTRQWAYGKFSDILRRFNM